jgi:hypothetical protein
VQLPDDESSPRYLRAVTKYACGTGLERKGVRAVHFTKSSSCVDVAVPLESSTAST